MQKYRLLPNLHKIFFIASFFKDMHALNSVKFLNMNSWWHYLTTAARKMLVNPNTMRPRIIVIPISFRRLLAHGQFREHQAVSLVRMHDIQTRDLSWKDAIWSQSCRRLSNRLDFQPNFIFIFRGHLTVRRHILRAWTHSGFGLEHRWLER